MNLAFADSPQGGGGAGTGREPPGKAYLLHKARSIKRSDLITRVAPRDSELLEEERWSGKTEPGAKLA